MIKKHAKLIGLLVVLGAVLCIGAGVAYYEQQITIDEVPELVKATILKEAGDGTIKEIEKETKNGVTTYEAELVVEGKTLEIQVAADGALLCKGVEDIEDDDKDDDDKDDDGDEGEDDR